MNKKILIIGAGSVGQVYGYYLATAGNHVTYYVKKKYVEELNHGIRLYHLNKDRKKKSPIQFDSFALISSESEISGKSWDQIYLCISSTALRQFDFSLFNNDANSKSTIVMLQPGLDDTEHVYEKTNKERVVKGVITMISYSTPLRTEQVDKPGTAFWIPPLNPTAFSGCPTRVHDIVQTFTKAKMPAKSYPEVGKLVLYPNACLMIFLTALEAAHWNFKSLSSNKLLLQQLCEGINEVSTSFELSFHSKPPFVLKLNHSNTWKILLKIAPYALPLDLETYLEFHFTKVKDQTKLYIDTFIRKAESQGLKANNLKLLNSFT